MKQKEGGHHGQVNKANGKLYLFNERKILMNTIFNDHFTAFHRPDDQPNYDSFNAPTKKFDPNKQFNSNNHFVYTPKPSNARNVRFVLEAKHLVFKRDMTTGALCSKDGRKSNPNLPLAEMISDNYGYNEPVFSRMRQIYATEQCAGLIGYSETGLSRIVLGNCIRMFTNAGIISRHTEYSTGFYVQLNPEARNFVSKEFAQINVTNYIKLAFHPEEIYFDTTLCEDRNPAEHYTADVIYRIDSSVKFVTIALNPKLLCMPMQIERLVRLANRLRSSVTIVVSPSVDITALSNTLRSRLDPSTSMPYIVPYTRLSLLR